MMLTRSNGSVAALFGVVLMVAALGAVACGDDDGDGVEASPTGVPTETMTTEPGATMTTEPSATMTESPSGEGSEVDVLMTDIAYDVEEIDATAGEPITVYLRNEGEIEHDFNIDAISVSDVSSTGGTDMSGEEAPIHLHLMPGENGSITFTPDEAGAYEFYCTQPGHEEAGMSGTLVVS